MIDPATGWFEIIEFPNCCIAVKRKGKEIIDVVIDELSSQFSKLLQIMVERVNILEQTMHLQ